MTFKSLAGNITHAALPADVQGNADRNVYGYTIYLPIYKLCYACMLFYTALCIMNSGSLACTMVLVSAECGLGSSSVYHPPILPNLAKNLLSSACLSKARRMVLLYSSSRCRVSSTDFLRSTPSGLSSRLNFSSNAATSSS